MIAPHAPGVALRDAFLGERNVSAFYAIYRDRNRKAMVAVTRLASAIGIRKSRLEKTTFADEAIGDLFGEQTVLCGGLAMLIKSGFETLVASGHKPDHAWLEVAYQLDLIVALIKKHGIEGMFSRISTAARYGSLLTGPKLIGAATRKRMQTVYDDIASGKFTHKLSGLSQKDLAKLDKQLRALSNPALEKAAAKFAR